MKILDHAFNLFYASLIILSFSKPTLLMMLDSKDRGFDKGLEIEAALVHVPVLSLSKAITT